GRARYTQYPTVFFPNTSQEYITQVHEFLISNEIKVPAEFLQYARRFLYYQLFRTGLPFERFLKTHPRPGYIRLKSFAPEDLLHTNAAAIEAVYEGVVNDAPFLV
ncbi:MAG: hypothetical protein N2C13_05565, partial [Chloroflexota bacterium]